MNDIRFSGITRVELHALSETEQKKVLENFTPGQQIKGIDTDVFIGRVPEKLDEKLYGDKLYIATGPGEDEADAKIKRLLTRKDSLNITAWTQDESGTFKTQDTEVIVDTGTLDHGHHGELYVFELNGKYKELRKRSN